MSSLRTVGVAALMLAAIGCGPTAASKQLVLTTSNDALTATNGADLNGISLNGFSQNGFSQNGFSQNGAAASGATITGIDFTGMTLSGTSITNVTLSGTQLVGVVASDAGIISGNDWKGVEMRAQLSNGYVYTAKITVVLPWEAAAGKSQNGPTLNGFSQNGFSQNGFSQNGFSQNGAGGRHTYTLPDAGPIAYVPGTPDMLAYAVVLELPSGDQPLCGLDANGDPVPAIPLAGRWDYRRAVPGGGAHIDDPSQFTFACMGAALAKCVELGYWPWTSADAADHHEACTRMIRADYCGDGTPHTVNGMYIDLYDNEGIQVDTENWPFEAEWKADGARCVAHQRIYDTTRVNCSTPHTFEPQATCGDLSHFQSGTLLMDEYSPSDQIR